MATRSLLGCERAELVRWLAERSYPAYRADQVLQWVYERAVRDWSAMSNVPKALRDALSEEFSLRGGDCQPPQNSADGTVKFLLRWDDGATSETVLIPTEQRQTVCVSSQVGCAVGCSFCASGLGGLERSLGAGEIVEQVMWVRDGLAEGERLSHVVVMGMGEPLANYDNTLRAVRIINADWGLRIGARHITISTIGLPKEIRRLAAEPMQFTLAVSVHAGDDELRGKLIPWAQKISLAEIFAAINYYYSHTRREVTLEYVLLAGVNSSLADADKLVRWARRSRCNVNLINYNAVVETGFAPATPATVKAFMQRLVDRGVNVHLRTSGGGDIDAACGQLRRRAKTAK